MSAQPHSFYPPPPSAASSQQQTPGQQRIYSPPPAAASPAQQQYNPPPTSPPTTQYAPPPTTSPPTQQQYAPPPTSSPPIKQYPAPPSATPSGQAQFYPPPPSSTGPSKQYAPPPQQTPSPHYPPPPSSPPSHEQQQQQQQAPPQYANLAMRPGAGQQYHHSPHNSQQYAEPPPPAFSNPSAAYPPEKADAHLLRQPQPQQPQFAAPPTYPTPDAAYPAEKTAAATAAPQYQQQQVGNRPVSQLSNQTAASASASAGPSASAFVGAVATTDDVGTFNGGSYRISHRDCNTILTIQLAMGCPLGAKPGAMIAMSPTMTLRGEFKFSVKKMIAGAELGHSHYIGPGELLLAPPMLGDITTIRLDGTAQWTCGHDAYLASTQGVHKDHKRQGLGKAMFSGEGLFVYKMSGTGILWVSSFGAIIRKDLADGEKYIIDNGHLVAWNTKYILERVASGGIISNLASAEGLVCKFTGPGTVYMQTRNGRAFAAFMGGQSYSGV
ncbi:DUF124 domain-containing protein [Cordyceps fumosorosea ARSEF 2679]|uniref:Altered inheritance of mitochondria protein 24, mitochondrial n=1 Tax=Cordyceps fumosorosea (strain ARSEF 2679) TaxID=1081104 RepID=A0A167QHS0_CORFA|nr:DUF124 domain-containing protein [Cordyceps fumosorosea ARSEF 2679]OAA57654.1 DUF124 domain-containing protein [Cordyceps fumosorosea ARSEF 2679]